MGPSWSWKVLPATVTAFTPAQMVQNVKNAMQLWTKDYPSQLSRDKERIWGWKWADQGSAWPWAIYQAVSDPVVVVVRGQGTTGRWHFASCRSSSSLLRASKQGRRVVRREGQQLFSTLLYLTYSSFITSFLDDFILYNVLLVSSSLISVGLHWQWVNTDKCRHPCLRECTSSSSLFVC